MNISLQGFSGRKSVHGMAGAAAVLAATLGVSLLGPHRAYAAPHPSPAAAGANDLGVTILSPDPQVPLSGVKPIEISAFYQGSPGNQIIAIELFIDGAKAATKTLDAPETRGVVSFLVDAGQIPAGSHQIVIRATAADQEVQSAKSRFTFSGMDPGATPLAGPSPSDPVLTLPRDPALSSGLPPTLRLFSPSPDGRVQGVVTLRVEATDPSGKAPYVSLFIDKTFKTLRNYAPYEFEWDTTAYSNGYHTIEAYGYNDTPNVGHAKTLRLYVNNPGGETGIRHDLLDAPAIVKPVLRPLRRAALPPVVRPIHIAAPKKLLSPARIALLTPRRSSPEIVRDLASGASALRFDALDFASALSAPSAALESAPAQAAPVQAAPARVPSFKPRHVADKTIVARPASDREAQALMAETPARTFAVKARLPQIASIHLPGSELASPFVAAPHASLLSAPAAKPALRPLVHAAIKTHALRVHLPVGMMSDLLRSAGQRTLLFNSKTVVMDRPLTAQNRVLFGPLRQIFEQGGGTLLWQSSTGTVRAKSATEDILLTLGDTHATVNAKSVTLDGKPYLMMGRTMVPLSFIAVAMDANVQFDAATGHLLVTSRK